MTRERVGVRRWILDELEDNIISPIEDAGWTGDAENI